MRSRCASRSVFCKPHCSDSSGLVLAFGLTLAVGRYEQRRVAVVDEANAIGTSYLRAQTLAEPQRSQSLALLRTYTDTSIRLSREVPGSTAARTTVAASGALQRKLWRLAGQALAGAPIASAPRLYVDSLNNTFNAQTTRIASRNNRVPGAVLTLELVGASAALGLLAPLSRDPRPRTGHRAVRGRARDAPSPRHLRPRPPDARPDPHSERAARRSARLDGAAARSHGSLAAPLTRQPAGATPHDQSG